MVWLMKKTLLTVALSMSISSAFLVGTASAATPTPNGVCSPAGSKTTIAAKNYVCAKVLSGKTVWILGMGVGTLSQNPTAPKPAISGSAGRGFGEESGGGREGEEHRGVNGINSAAMKKFNDCLVKHGGSSMSPRSSAVQKKAVAACSALEPKFIRHSGEDD
jgi:hypothetical protein